MKEIVVDGNETYDYSSEVLKQHDVDDIEFRNCEFLNEELLKIIEFKKYKRVAFVDCSFENESLIKNIKTESISFTNCTINNYEFIYEMNDLKNLTIVNGKVDANKLNNLPNLNYLRVSNSYVENIETLYLNNLNYLFVDNTNIKDLSFVINFPNLKLLSISEDQKTDNLDALKLLSSRIRIILDSIIEMEVNLYD